MLHRRSRTVALATVIIVALTLSAGCLKKPGTTPPDVVTPGGGEPVQTEPVLDAARGVYKLPPVVAPTGDATAWAELGTTYEDGYTPLSITFTAKRGNVVLTTEAANPIIEDTRFINWIDATTVILGEQWLADLSGAGKLTRLPESAMPGMQLSPDRTRIAFWGKIGPDPNTVEMGPQLYNIATGQITVVKTFTTEDWGFEGSIEVLPHVAWLDNGTLLFDGPQPDKTSVFRCALASGELTVFRDDGWQVCASGDGKYVALAHADASGEYATYVINMADGKETQLDRDKYPYPSTVTFSGDRFVVVSPWTAVGAGRMIGGVPVIGNSAAKAGYLIIDAGLSGDAAVYCDLSVSNGKVDRLTMNRLQTVK